MTAPETAADPNSRSGLSGALSRLRERGDAFFFAREVPYGLAAVRIVLCATLLCTAVARWPHARDLWSTDGVVVQLSELMGLPPVLPELPPELAVPLASLLVLSLACGAVGFCTRVAVPAAFLLYLYFGMLDTLSTMTKYSVIAAHTLLMLSLSDCGAVWSVDAWRRRLADPGHQPRTSAVWPRRLIQLMIGLCYFGAAMTKVHTAGYFSGDQLRFWTLTDYNNHNPVGEWFSLYPVPLAAMGYIAIVWEISFLMLAWRGVGRWVMLGLGVGFHAGTYFLLGLYILPLVTIATYFAFFGQTDYERAAAWCRAKLAERGIASQAKRTPAWVRKVHSVPATTGLALLVGLFAVGGSLAERTIEPYRQADGSRFALPEVPAEKVKTMIAATPKVRLVDKLFSFRVGQGVVVGNLADQRDSFGLGETATVEACFVTPHEDLWVECDLYDPTGGRLGKVTTVLTREKHRCHFNWTFPTCLGPGDYDIVLACRGEELARKTIRVTGDGSCAAPTEPAITGGSAPLAN